MNSGRSLTGARFGAAFYSWLRDRWTAGLALHSDVALILVVSRGLGRCCTTCSSGTCQSLRCGIRRRVLRCSWLPVRRDQRACRRCCLRSCRHASACACRESRCSVVAAAGSFFASDYGAVMNTEMMRNLLETDRAEVGGLMSFTICSLISWCSRVVPAVLVWRVKLPSSTWRAQLRQRLIFIGAVLAVCAVALFASSASRASSSASTRRCVTRSARPHRS